MTNTKLTPFDLFNKTAIITDEFKGMESAGLLEIMIPVLLRYMTDRLEEW